MSTRLPSNLRPIEPLAEGIVAAAAATAKAATKTYKALRRRRGYAALRPGADTPLWNELARACAKQLTRYGDQAKLARILGVPRQRVHMLLITKTAYPDAERTLRLLAWLSARRKGFRPA